MILRCAGSATISRHTPCRRCGRTLLGSSAHMGRVPRVPRPPNRRFHAYRQGCALMPKDWSRGQPPLRRCDWQPARRSTPLQSGLSLTTIAATSSRMDRMNDLPSVGWLSESAARDHQILANPRAIRPRSESYAIKWARAIVLATQIGGLLLPALNAYLPCQIAGPMKKKRHNPPGQCRICARLGNARSIPQERYFPDCTRLSE
jgi:hypothetical protein